LNPEVRYAPETGLSTAAFRQVLLESGLGAHRPVDDEARLQAMLAGANVIVTARLDQADRRLVGVARGISDGSWCCYLSDLAVSKSAQGFGIGRGLLDETRRQIGPGVSLILASYPDATPFYEKIGMPRWPDMFWYARER
jgi:GNAT superfamily N-acetyltransferase